MNIGERKHRLPDVTSKGQMSAAFTLRTQGGEPLFIHHGLVAIFSAILTSVIEHEHCIVPVYCYMPDHQHIIITGTEDVPDLHKVISHYKDRTDDWMYWNTPKYSWQKGNYGRIIKDNESLVNQVRYILDNPVRKGIVSSWDEYPFKGSIGCRHEDILSGLSY